MHTISDDSVRTVDEILDLVRHRLLDDDLPLGAVLSSRDLAERSEVTIDEDGHGTSAVLDHFTRVLAPACIAADDPRYLSFIPAAPTSAAIAFDLAVTASSIFAGFRQTSSGAVFAEDEAIRWLAHEFGLPTSSGGTFVQGGTLGNLSALVAARDRARRRTPVAPDRWRVVCSREAHSSIVSAAHVMDVDVVLVDCDTDGSMRGPAVRAALDAHGDSVFAVVATAGSTNCGTVDDIAGIAGLRPGHDFWLHVDGAYGLAGMLSPLTRPLFDGVADADSVIVDPHKWLFAPHDACALIYRDPEGARRSHTQRAPYLDVTAEHIEPSPADYAVHLTRRARGLALWYSLASHGAAAYRAAITSTITTARTIAEEIERRPHLRLIRHPQLSIVAFERAGWGHGDYAAWSATLLAEQVGFVAPTSTDGRPHLRFAIINPRTTVELLLRILDTLDEPRSR
ncbi:pyridoxal phosphate-dependent decarboxylase family protein [Curtobacterium flaccumfaciens]|uniref:pyridoxal phosphate-dependent decarboxylase family protein n=1 Tax=Curtobacterium flaccumfaciens TaxID=2035 RepID=UPI0037C1949D